MELFQTYHAIVVGIGLDWACRNGCYDEKIALKQMFDVLILEQNFIR